MNRKGFLTRLLAGAFALPAVAKMEFVPSVPDKQYADGLLGELQLTRDLYNAAFPEPARYFMCSKETMKAMWREVFPSFDFKLGDGMQVYRVEGMDWIRDEMTPWHLFEVTSRPGLNHLYPRRVVLTQDLLDKVKPKRGEFDKLMKEKYAEMRAKGMI